MMRLLIVLLLLFSVFCPVIIYAHKGTFVDKVKFVQYLDENTALESVKKGNLDLYYFSIPPDRIDDPKSREGLNIYQTTGSSYGLIVNPSISNKTFNPFSLKEVRFALNYLVDRDFIVNELLGGYGVQMISAYGPFDPDYLLILDTLESFNIRYDPEFAEKMISDALIKAGAKKIDDKWFYNSEPIEITFFIRSEDKRKEIGELISSKLEKIGFSVKKEYGDLNKFLTLVKGSDPCDLGWNIATEGYGGRSVFIKYDTSVSAQMYAPWLGNMPGGGVESYCNYQNDLLDSVTQSIYLSNFTSSEQRTKLIKEAVSEGIKESVRFFLVSKIDPYISNKKIEGVVNDFSSGITSRFTPINVRTNSDTLTIGVKQLYQGAWNPVKGFADKYSRDIWNSIADPGTFKHPFTGITIPVRSEWKVESGNPTDIIEVPSDAIRWDTKQQMWVDVGEGKNATSKVTFDLKFANWHNRRPMDMNDILYSLYFLYEWGSVQDENETDKTFDPEYSPEAQQTLQTLVGVRIIDKDTIEVYQNYWHIDQSEIAFNADVWTAIPWEIFSAMEKLVIDGKYAFSKSQSSANSLDQVSMIVPNHANAIKSNLAEYVDSDFIPVALKQFQLEPEYYKSRYNSSISWISKYNHAVISNGPFYLESYMPEARTITMRAFDDPTYPFEQGHWKEFSDFKLARINRVDLSVFVSTGKELIIPVSLTPNSVLYYYFTNGDGRVIKSGIEKSTSDKIDIKLSPQETSQFDLGSNSLEMYLVSESALRPDIYRTSFLVIDGEKPVIQENLDFSVEDPQAGFDYVFVIIALAVLTLSIIILKKRR